MPEYNAILTKEKNEVETIINEAIFNDQPITRNLFDKSENKGSSDQFIDKHVKQNEGKLSEGRIKHYKSIQKKIKAFNPKLKFKDIPRQSGP
ncbi:MAG TPA: phage integrase SAM-like domain-containing protein [Arachidicoccus sp.]|nr:phage integrase SAM-like domain-containing protein [Arachidicoccus sp.]